MNNNIRDGQNGGAADEGAWVSELPINLVVQVLTPLAVSIVQATIEEANAGNLDAVRIKELAIGAIAANSELLATAAADAAELLVGRDESEALREHLIRDLRTGSGGTNLAQIVLNELSTGKHEAVAFGAEPDADVRALMELDMQCRAIVGMELGRLLESGVRDRLDLISAASDALTAATPRLVDSLRATLLADGFPAAEANRRAENLRGKFNSIAIAALATQIALEILADRGGLDL